MSIKLSDTITIVQVLKLSSLFLIKIFELVRFSHTPA